MAADARDNSQGLSHIAADGRARMVDVGDRPPTERRAVAAGRLRMRSETARAVELANGPKGDVVGPARIAGIMAAKRTAELIPMCHPLVLSFVDVGITVDSGTGVVDVSAEVRTTAATGVEMEAMTACSVAALTVYDMVKGLERGVTIESVVLLEKHGGREPWQRGAP